MWVRFLSTTLPNQILFSDDVDYWLSESTIEGLPFIIQSYASSLDLAILTADSGSTITDSDGNSIFQDCNGDWGGGVVVDGCGVCGGDGTSCQIIVNLSLGDAADGGLDVFMSNTHPVQGFQFAVSGMDVLEASGGSAALNGFNVAAGPNGIIGFSLTGDSIPAGNGLLTSLSGSFNDFEACIDDLILSVDGEGFHTYSSGDCVQTDAVADCNGIVNGDATLDDCGVCGGDGSSCRFDVLYDSSSPIYGFQFGVNGVSLSGASGGAAENNGFMVTAGTNGVIGFSLDGASIPAGSGVLTTLVFDSGDVSEACLEGLVISGHADGSSITGAISDCLTVYYESGCNDDLACNYNDGATEDDGSCTYPSGCDETCGSTLEFDDCGVCGGDGSDDLGCGCFEPGPSGCDETCGSTLEFDDCGVCGGDGSDDLGCGCFEPGPSGCDETCGSTLEFDDCGVCGGDGSDDLGCGCFEPGPSGCDETCGSTLEFDDCGVCGGDGSSCRFDVLYDSSSPIYGFQFGVNGVSLSGASGGAAENNGFMVTAGTNGVIGFSLDGASIPAGSGVLTTLVFDSGDVSEACLEGLVISGHADGSSITGAISDCLTVYYESGCNDDLACNYNDGATEDDGSCTYPSGCDETCGSTLEFDDCGVCGGDGSDDLGCGCFEPGPSGCDETCGSTLEFDDCGVCGGDGSDDLGCGCFEPGPSGCDETCGSTLEFDDCGVCGGDGSDDLGCGCFEPGPSGCDETCGSTLEFDDCGVCGGDNLTMDECGVCDGDNSSCTDCDGVINGSAYEDVCGECNDNPADDCAADQSQAQAFYYFSSVTLDGVSLESGDYILAFHNSVLLGGVEWSGENTVLSVMGLDDTPFTDGFIESGGVPDIVIYDVSTDSYISSLVEMVPAFVNNEIYFDISLDIITDCNGDLGGTAIIDSCDDCSGGNSGHGYDANDPDSDGICNLGAENGDVDNCQDISNPDQFDYDLDGAGDACDIDDDNDGALDENDSDDNNAFICSDNDNDTCDECASGTYQDPSNDGSDYDGDGTCDAGDLDDDNDGALDDVDSDDNNEFVCSDDDNDTCDDCSDGSYGLDDDGSDYDGDGTCDAGDLDDDNDGALDDVDSDDNNEFVCSDDDNDTCDDCSDGSYGLDSDGFDYDLDGLCDAGDLDDDNDGALDENDSDDNNAFVCSDNDNDTCDDCSDGSYGLDSDGFDYDLDGLCDAGDLDDDNDGALDENDSDDNNAFVCSDDDNDTCDECASGTYLDPSSDGFDYDLDGLCDAGDLDDDNDGALDENDSDDNNAFVCSDDDNDSCDDCSDGSYGLDDDGFDYDDDGACDAGDLDDDNDGALDENDSDDNNEFVCSDDDNDTCDECASGTYLDPSNDGFDYDGDGACDAGDLDDDNDGALDENDSDDNNAFVCSDDDNDSCDDCSDGSYGLDDDGPDNDGDGACDAGDLDDDNDGVADDFDSEPFNERACSDDDNDTCDDCSNGYFDLSNDGFDYDGDGACDAGDLDDDNDGALDENDSDDNNAFVCSDDDNDSCDDCSSGTYNPNEDGIDSDGDGICNDGDSTPHGEAGIAFGEITESTLVIEYTSTMPIYGFQFQISGLEDTYQVSSDFDFIDVGTNGVIAFGLGGAALTAGEGTLAIISFTPQLNARNISISDVLLSGHAGGNISVSDDLSNEVPACAQDQYSFDADSDGQGHGGSSAICNALVEEGWVTDHDDNCPETANSDQLDYDLDGQGDACDADDDNDTVLDGDDTDPFNSNICQDLDNDTCDDCSTGAAGPNTANDGFDYDGDGACDAGDLDDDNDGALDDVDSDDNNAFVCSDVDEDTCDDCSDGFYGLDDDGFDYDGDGACDAGDLDDDNDGALDGVDSDDNNAFICSDVDEDTCDDCSDGSYGLDDDGLDNDSDGICNDGDFDDDNDGALDQNDSDDNNPFVCSDDDNDTCDDCSSGSYGTDIDGPDGDFDGMCDAGDSCLGGDDNYDIDGDGKPDDCDVDLSLNEGSN